MLGDPMIEEDHHDESASCHSNTGLFTPECLNNGTSGLDSKKLSLPHGLYLTIILGTLAVAVNLVAFFGNVIVLLAFTLDRKIRQPRNYFLASLASSDLITAVVAMPLYTVYILLDSWVLGPWICDIWLSLDWSACVTSKYTVFFLAMDRFLGVTIPIKYRNWCSKNKILLIISITWLVPAVIFFTAIIGWQQLVGNKRKIYEDECQVQFLENTSFTFLLLLGYFWIPLVFMCIFYAGIYRVALNLERRSTMRLRHVNTMRELAEPNPVVPNFNIYSSADHESKSNNNRTGTDFFIQSQTSQQSGHLVMPYSVEFQTLHVKKEISPLKSSKDDYHSTTAVLTAGESNCLTGELGHLGSFSVYHVTKAASGGPQRMTSSVITSLLIDCNLASLTSAAFENLPRGFRRPFIISSYDFKPTRTRHKNRACYSTTFGGSENLSQSFNSQQTRQSSIITDQKRQLATLSWNSDSSSIAVSTLSVIASSDMTGLYLTPIWKLHPFQSSQVASIFELENKVHYCPLTTKLILATGQPKACTLPPCTAHEHSTHQQLLLEIKVREVASSSAAAGSDKDYTIGQSSDVTVHTYCSSEHSQRRGGSFGVDSPTANIKLSQAPSWLLDDRQSSDDTNVHSLGRRRFWFFRRQRRPSAENPLQNRTRKTLRTLTLILGAFILCWTPYSVVIIVLAFCPDCVSPALYSFTYWLCYLNSPLNPFCYAFANPQYRVAFLRIMRLDWHRT